MGVCEPFCSMVPGYLIHSAGAAAGYIAHTSRLHLAYILLIRRLDRHDNGADELASDPHVKPPWARGRKSHR